MLQILANMPAATLDVQLKFKGPSLTVSTACASGLSAIIEGFKWIRLNEADLVIVGASEDVYNPLYLYSSLRLQAMSAKEYPDPSQSSRPFDKARSGFILGEGSGVLVLESLEHAQKRGAPIIAEIAGYGYTSDGFHLVRPEASGEGQVNSMKKALSMAGI
jgi:3-oxoacyl-[acyl-carrier-protein] synthase II